MDLKVLDPWPQVHIIVLDLLLKEDTHKKSGFFSCRTTNWKRNILFFIHGGSNSEPSLLAYQTCAFTIWAISTLTKHRCEINNGAVAQSLIHYLFYPPYKIGLVVLANLKKTNFSLICNGFWQLLLLLPNFWAITAGL